MILKLGAVRDRQRALVGGKAANLACLVLNGFPVPSGFCVTSAAFNLFLQSCSPWERLRGRLEQLSLERLSEVTILSREINACLAGMAVPEPVQRAVAQACLDHGQDQAYAVRSSATVEDARDHSFAGQYDSFLNVRGQEALLEAIKACWLSLFSARALTYQLQTASLFCKLVR